MAPHRDLGGGAAFGVVALIGALALGVALVMWRTTSTLLAEWGDTENLTYTHGYLIVAISIWAVVRSRAAIARAAIAPNPVLVPVIALVSILWLIAYQAALLVVNQALLPIAMWLTVFAVCGWQIARRCWFAFAYLYFAVPVWSMLNSTLQTATTIAMKTLLPVFGIPAYFSGNTVYIPSGVFEIAGGCSGLHFFVVAIAIAALYGEIHRDSLKARLLLVSIAALLSVLANWLRVFTIIVAGHLTDMTHFLIRVDHYYFGWFVFAISMAIFLYAASRIPQSALEEKQPIAAHGRTPAARAALVAAFAVLALALGPFRIYQVSSESSDTDSQWSLPQLTQNWRGPGSVPTDWRPTFPHADAQLQGVYRNGSREAEVFIALYDEQRQGKEFGGSGNSTIGAGLEPQTSRHRLPNGFGERTAIDSAGVHWVIWDVYFVGRKNFYAATQGQLWYGLSSLWSGPASAVVAVRSRCREGCDQARASNAEFLQASELADYFAR